MVSPRINVRRSSCLVGCGNAVYGATSRLLVTPLKYLALGQYSVSYPKTYPQALERVLDTSVARRRPGFGHRASIETRPCRDTESR